MLYREQLDHMRCGRPGCTHENHGGDAVYLHGRCHMDSPSWVKYEDGVVTVSCSKCKRPIAEIAVAWSEHWQPNQ